MGACCCPSNLAMVIEEPGEGRRCGPYIMKDMLGMGSQAKVWLCTSKNIEGQLFAAKVMKKRSLIKRHHKKKLGKYGKATGKIAREIAIMKRLRHEHVVNLFDVLDDPNQNFLVMVLEYMPGGTVASDLAVTKALELSLAISYFQQLVLGLEYLHHHDIFHRDIKPSNLLLSKDKKTLKISDFGVSEFLHTHNDSHYGFRGTVAFLAPETFGTQAFHAAPVDIWAAGVTLFVMLYGKIPFGLVVNDDDEEEDEDGRKSPSSRFYTQSTQEEIKQEICSGKVRWPHRKFRDTAEMTLRKLFRVDPESRVTLAGLKRDSWLRQGSWAGGSTPSLTKKHLEKILVTDDEVHDAVKSVPRDGEKIQHLSSVVVEDGDGGRSTKHDDEDTKARVVKIEMSSGVSSKDVVGVSGSNNSMNKGSSSSSRGSGENKAH